MKKVNIRHPKNTKNTNWEGSLESVNSMSDIMKFCGGLDSINLETHSSCNYSKIHCTQCPVATRESWWGKTVLDIETMSSFFSDLSKVGYVGTTFFHSYSEPLMDKRIYKIIELNSKLCPQAKSGILTNGKLLNEKVVDKLTKSGVSVINISSYHIQDPTEVGIAEGRRLYSLIDSMIKKYPKVSFNIDGAILDDRMNFYDYGWDNPVHEVRPPGGLQPCDRPRDQLVISSTGDLQLCCYEWKKENRFGNITEKSIITILENSNYLNMARDLDIGMRDKYFPCDRCF